MRTLIPLTLALLSNLALAGGSGAAPAAHLTPTPCQIALPDGFQEGKDATCAYLSVPQRYDQATHKTFKLFVVRLHPSGHALRPDPVIYLHGGPGGDIDQAVSYLGAPFLDAAGGREVVFFDQRGSGRSTGQLDCRLPSVSAQDSSGRNAATSYRACRLQLLHAGTDLSAYSSAQIAGDIERLRIALGASQINLYGLSYGTRVAQEVMRRAPAHLRSVVLDSPVVAGWSGPSAPAFNQTLNNAFALCRNDVSCSSTYGDLQLQFPAFLKQLDRQPPEVSVIDPATGNDHVVKLTSTAFLSALFNRLYQASSPYSLPNVLNQAMHGSYTDLQPVITRQFASTAHFSPVGALIDCSDQPSVTDEARAGENTITAEIRQWGQQSDQWEKQICTALRPDARVSSASHLNTGFPTLILTGGIDPITPPLQGKMIERLLTQATLINFPMNGHGQAYPGRPSDACAFGLLQAFWSAPIAELDSRCTSGIVPAS